MRSARPSRFEARLAVLPRAARTIVATAGRRRRPTHPRRVLVAHNLLLGDTLMLAPLFAGLRERYPHAEVVTTAAKAFVQLFAGRPWGVRAFAYDPRDVRTVEALHDAGPFDLAIVPGENRHAVLALSLGAPWIVAMAGDRPGWKNRLIDELMPVPASPAALADIFAVLAGAAPSRSYKHGDWPAPLAPPFELPSSRYAVLHVGAGSRLRLWEAGNWRALAASLAARGIAPVWSAGPGEERIVAEIDPEHRFLSYAGRLSLPQVWRLIEGARLLVTLDTGVLHMAKLAMTPTVALFGPGSQVLFGPGRFFRDWPFRAATIDPFPCRDQRTLFKREIAWVRRCQRAYGECPAPLCMQAIDVAMVERAVSELLEVQP